MRPTAPAKSPTTAPTTLNTPDCEWLVSVRDIREAKLAVEYGIDILDLKEPSQGSLTPVSVEIWGEMSSWNRDAQQTNRSPNRNLPRLSAALGESEQAISVAGRLPAEFDFAKAGPSKIRSESQLCRLWESLRSKLPPSVELVAVAYADHVAAGSLSAETILNLAAKEGFCRILLDTFDKTRGSAIDLCGHRRINEFADLAHQHRFWWSLAGSIKLDELAGFATLFDQETSFPSCVAVRGDVCEGNRTGSLSRQRMQSWADALQ